MAQSKDIIFNMKINGVDREIKTMGDLKKALKDSKDELLKYDQGSDAFKKAQKNIKELDGALGDLNDTTKITGSNSEQLRTSFGLFSEGVSNFDGGKMQIGLQGIGTAMKAIPLVALMSLFTSLLEKFDVVGKALDFISGLFYKLTDAIGFTHKAEEERSKATLENLKKEEKAIQSRYEQEIKLAQSAGKRVEQLEIDKAKAVEENAHNQVEDLKRLQVIKGELNEEEKKQYEELQEALAKAHTERLALELAATKKNQEATKEYYKLAATVQEQASELGMTEREKEIHSIKKQYEEQKKELLKSFDERGSVTGKEYKRRSAIETQLEANLQKEINTINAKYYKEQLEKRRDLWEKDYAERLKRLEDERKWNEDNEKYLADLEAKRLARQKENAEALAAANAEALNQSTIKGLNEFLISQKYNALSFEDQKANIEKLRDEKLKNTALTEEERIKIIQEANDAIGKIDNDAQKARFEIAANGLASLQALSDTFYNIKFANTKKMSAEEEAAARKQFVINKGINIAQTAMSGYAGVVNAISAKSMLPEPLATIQRVANIATIVATTAASISKISAMQFDTKNFASGVAGGATGGSSNSLPIPPTQAPSTQASTRFDEQGNNLNNQGGVIKAYVVETEISSNQNRINRLQDQATFG